ncbi:MAG: M1 family metallopeptidase [Nitrososphaerota archaeon]|nr:M1 family metallopeptidase [Nitrososphaerota archaeon]MDG6923198.1 M1 family metallopeptidase [Nitrososphaerota archaeon]
MEIKEYSLSLDIDFHSLNINGHEKITIADTEESLTLDSFGLKINGVQIDGKDVRFEQDDSAKKVRINDLSKKSYEVTLDYVGRVTEKALYGVYKSKYGSDYFVTTDFEPNGARLLFPCVDNPSFKAEFSLEVTTQSGLKVVANSKTKSTTELGGKTRHVFEKTPKMATYLFYLGIGNFDLSTLKDKNIEFRVLARPGNAAKGKFALENAVKFLRGYEDYYGIKYPLEKLDLIALPEYASGAMENWGAITFREVMLLLDENSSTSNRRSVTSVLGHEIAHMWFGDLVTMRWWNDLWLNESFATFMESKMTDKIYPHWNVESDFVQQNTASSMQSDSLSSTHPIDIEVKSPEEISQIFDEISYGKGASVLRMIDRWIGDDAFRAGVSNYLSEFKYSNGEGKDLWRHLEKASSQPVSEVMEAWVKKPGLPIVSVSFGQGKLKFSQERFLLRGNSTRDVWPIPITYSLNGEVRKFILKDNSLEIPAKNVDRIKVNLGQTGYYRVLYDQKLYAVIQKEFDKLSAFDRWGIITDLYAFLMAGKIGIDQYLLFAKRAADETDYVVADAVTSELQFLRFISPENSTLRQAYLNHHLAQMNRLGTEARSGEKDTDKVLRGRVATGLAMVDESFARNLSTNFDQYESVDPNLRIATSVAFAQTKGGAGYDKLVNTMKRMANEADVMKIYVALTSFRDPKLVEKTLNLCISGEISRADSLYAVLDAAQNPFTRETTWKWVTSNFHVFRELFSGTPYLSQVMQEVISRAGIDREDNVKDYLSKTKIAEAEKGIRKGLELLEIYSSLKKRLGGLPSSSSASLI